MNQNTLCLNPVGWVKSAGNNDQKQSMMTQLWNCPQLKCAHVLISKFPEVAKRHLENLLNRVILFSALSLCKVIQKFVMCRDIFLTILSNIVARMPGMQQNRMPMKTISTPSSVDRLSIKVSKRCG